MPEEPTDNQVVNNTVDNSPLTNVQSKIIYEWIAPSRPFKRRDREFYVTLITISTVVGLIIFFTEGWMPVILLISLIFLFYVMNTIQPDNIKYQITNSGIKVAGRLTEWRLITRFWFTKRTNSELVVFELKSLPGRLELVITPDDKEKIKEAAAKFVIEEEASPSFLDKTTDLIAKKLPGNS